MSDEIKYEDPQFQSFNESLDEEGEIKIADIPFQRSCILFELAKETYKDAYGEFCEQEFEKLKQYLIPILLTLRIISVYQKKEKALLIRLENYFI